MISNNSSQHQSQKVGTTVSKTLDEEELDKLLQGLDQLTETLPDLSSPPRTNHQFQPQQQHQQQQQPKMETLNSHSLYSNSNGMNSSNGSNGTSNGQPYHTRHDSKPFSYFMKTSTRSNSRASSNNGLSSSAGGASALNTGLESPNILRKIMHVNLTSNGSNSLNDSMSIGTDSRPLSPSVISRGSSPGRSTTNDNTLYSRIYKSNSSSLIKDQQNSLTDEDLSLTWLQRQQKKLEERKSVQRRREGHPGGLNPGSSSEASLMRELKTSLDRARSETTDGYAASEVSIIFSEDTSTRESSPHKHYPKTSTPKIRPSDIVSLSSPAASTIQAASMSAPSSNLTRHVSDSSYDRSRPLIQRRLRYDSEQSEISQLNGAGSEDGSCLSRPITPGFPTVPPTPIFGQSGSSSTLKRLQQASNLRSASPSMSMYHGASSGINPSTSRASSRRGSFSSEPADVAPSHVQLAKDHYKYWYKPHISREEAIALLRSRAPGSFVVRDSNSFPGAFGLALKVATPPLNAPQNGDELIRHFLIEPTTKGVKLKGYSNEPVFGSLSALVYQHTVTPLALPSRLILPESDLSGTPHDQSNRDSTDSKTSMKQLLSLGAACNVLYLFSMETDSLTGPSAIKKAVSQLMLTRPKPHATLVHFKVSSQGITLTDHGRKLFFRKHYNTTAISFCGIDSEDRRWSIKQDSTSQTSQRIFGFVARKSASRGTNQCHLFAEQDPDQPARAIVNFVNKILLNSGNSARADVV